MIPSWSSKRMTLCGGGGASVAVALVFIYWIILCQSKWFLIIHENWLSICYARFFFLRNFVSISFCETIWWCNFKWNPICIQTHTPPRFHYHGPLIRWKDFHTNNFLLSVIWSLRSLKLLSYYHRLFINASSYSSACVWETFHGA